MPRLLTLFLFLLITHSYVLGQADINAYVQQYTTDNGLPSNGIKGMQWDEKNEFLWLATEAGIVRFNGVDFKSYSKQNMASIVSERMLFMIRSNSGKIYSSDQKGNVFLIDKSNPVLWRKPNVTSGKNEELDHYYLLATSDAFFQRQVKTPGNPGFVLTYNRMLCINDTACIFQRGSSLFYYSISSKDFLKLSFLTEHFTDAFGIGSRIFVVNDKKETFLLNMNETGPGSTSLTPIPNPVLKMGSDNDSIYWQPGMSNPILIQENKAWLLNYEDNAITTKLICDNIPRDSYIAWVQFSEKNNLLFIGTESKGLIVINQNRVRSRKRNNISKNRNSYYSQIELPDGNILTNESDVIGDQITDIASLPIQGKFSFNITQTDENTFWYTQGEGGTSALHRYDKIKNATKLYPKIKWGDIIAVSGNKIYSANFNGIGVLDHDSLIYISRFPKSLVGTVIFDFKEIQPGIMAIASCAGLLRFNLTTNRLDTIFTKENICVRSIWKYKDYLFFGTYGSGFYIYKNGIIKPMPLDKNKYLLYPHCFVQDDNGYCWISTNRGLFKANLTELIDAFENNRSTIYYHYFGKKDGMEMTELNGGCTPCALVLKNKTISFPTMDGLLWVDPAKAIPMLPSGEIFIDEVLVNNVRVDADSFSIKKLPANSEKIFIQLGFSAWCNKENIYIEYRINDMHDWKPVNTDNDAVIRLYNLPTGNYSLQVRKLNGFGINNYSYKEIRFSISTPWHKQWWFYLLGLLAFFGLAALYFQFRTRQYKIRQRRLEKQVAEKTKELIEKNEVLEKNNTIKTRLISIISHDIVTPLKFVTVAGKNLIEKRDLMPEELQQETILEMTNTAQELQLLSTNMLNWIKYQNENRRLAKETFNVHELVNQVLGVLNSLARQKKLVLVNQVNKDLEIRQFFEPLKILVYNLLTNAINFSEKGSIVISAGSNNETVIISVQDEGVGMTAEQIKNVMADQFIISSANIDNRKGNGLGYLIIKDLLKMMDASLKINSEKGKGTIVSIHLPVEKK